MLERLIGDESSNKLVFPCKVSQKIKTALFYRQLSGTRLTTDGQHRRNCLLLVHLGFMIMKQELCFDWIRSENFTCIFRCKKIWTSCTVELWIRDLRKSEPNPLLWSKFGLSVNPRLESEWPRYLFLMIKVLSPFQFLSIHKLNLKRNIVWTIIKKVDIEEV